MGRRWWQLSPLSCHPSANQRPGPGQRQPIRGPSYPSHICQAITRSAGVARWDKNKYQGFLLQTHQACLFFACHSIYNSAFKPEIMPQQVRDYDIINCHVIMSCVHDIMSLSWPDNYTKYAEYRLKTSVTRIFSSKHNINSVLGGP